jgi:hypothetical protein
MLRELIIAIIIVSVSFVVSFAQDPTAIRPVVITGEVISISTNEIELKTDTGQVTVEISERTEIKRVPPDNPRLAAATPAELSDLGVGDRVAATGVPSNDRRRLPARTIYLITKSDIEQKQAAERQRWATRGMSGRVASVNRETGQITVEVRGIMGSSNVVVTPKENAVFRKYAQDSVDYSETIISSLVNIEEGDMIRALGDRGPDGLSFLAEEIVTGAFQTIAGTVKSVDVEKREITISDLQSETDIVVAIGPGSSLRRFPEEMAMRMAGGPGAGPSVQPGAGGARPAGQQPTAAQGQPGQGVMRPGAMGGATRNGIDDMFERFPTITAADLKPGDMIAVSSSRNGNATKVTAIKLLAGVEPFIRAAQMAGQIQRGRSSVGGGFTIPGLDGFDFP